MALAATMATLIALPVAYVRDLAWGMCPLSLVANLVFFVIDECSGEMELPFGNDENDVEVEKILRRIDKLSAAQFFTRFGPEHGPISPITTYTPRHARQTPPAQRLSVSWRSSGR